MKDWTKWKPENGDIILPVVASASIASVGVANGRNIAVVFVPSDPDQKIDHIISIHKTIKEGVCACSWGLAQNRKNIILVLEFEEPIKQRFFLIFDIIKFGIVVEQIMHTQCLLLTTGDEHSKLSLCLDRAKIFLEVYCDEFKKVWDGIFRDTYARHLRKKHNYSKKVAYEIFDRMLKEMAVLKNLRM